MSREKTSQLPLLLSLSQPEVDPRSERSPDAATRTVPSVEPSPALNIRSPGALLFHQAFGRMEQETRPGFHLFMGAGRTSALALPFAAFFAVRGETVAVVEAANNFNLYRLTEWARRQGIAPLELLNRLRIARSFTPFQLAVILEHIGREMTRYRATRLVVTGLPDCLYDEELTEVEARNTFARCRRSLERLAAQTAVLIFAESPPHKIGNRARFQEALLSLARTAFEVHPGEPAWFVTIKAPGLLLVNAKVEGDS